MSRKQWGHGFHTGVDVGHVDGYEDGYEAGKEVRAMFEAEQLDLLIELMARLLNEPVGARHWALLQTISEVNAKNMLTPERAWHRRQATDKQEPAGESASEAR